LGIALAAALSECSCKPQQTCGVIVATNFVANDGKTDVSDALQKLVNDNPNRQSTFPTERIYFRNPLKTPADPKKSVSLKLSNFVILKAADSWSESEAVVCFGAIHPANNINSCGSLYGGIEGGIIDFAGKANGVSVDDGRETFIRKLSIKNAKIGVHIKRGANGGSSDADVRDVNATGTNSADSIGLLVEGYDNTFTNMRMASFHTERSPIKNGNFEHYTLKRKILSFFGASHLRTTMITKQQNAIFGAFLNVNFSASAKKT